MGKKFIKRAIRKPGSLTATVRQKFGPRGFTKRGTIRVSVLRKLAAKGGPKTRKRAGLALTLRKLRRT